MNEIDENTSQNEVPEMGEIQNITACEQPQESASAEITEQTLNPAPALKANRKCSLPSWIHWAVEALLAVAIIVLFCLHFCNKSEGDSKKVTTADVKKSVQMKPGNGSIVYVNLDEVEKSTLWKEKMDQLAADSAAFSQSYQSKMTPWQNKYNQWQQDYAQYSQRLQNGLPSDEATETRLVNTEQQLQTEYQNMENDLNKKLTDFAKKQDDIFQDLLTNMRLSASTVNHEGEDAPHASFVITYSEATAAILLVDPTRDITAAVIEEMTKNSHK